jgi:hypothetical protein
VIKHIVMWKLAADDPAVKAQQTEEIRAALEGLVGVVPGLLSLTVRPNALPIENNCDVVLEAEYPGPDELRAYVEHPEHQRAGAIPRGYASSRVAIDVEL